MVASYSQIKFVAVSNDTRFRAQSPPVAGASVREAWDAKQVTVDVFKKVGSPHDSSPKAKVLPAS